MAVLINGDGNEAIYAQQDADWFAALMGGTTIITGIGEMFEYELLDANTIGVKDGVIITQEGRRIQLDTNEVDSFDIPTGAQGTTNYYIIGYHLVTDDESVQTAETFVQLMDNGTDTIPEGSFKEGDDDVYISLYRVQQDDLTIGTITLLLPTVTESLQGQINQINTDLSDINDELAEVTTSSATLIDTVTSFSRTTDLTYDFSQYNEILFVVTGHYSSSDDHFHIVARMKPLEIELIRADTSYKEESIAPSVNIALVSGISSSNGYYALVKLFVMATANTYRLYALSSGYGIANVRIYGLK